MAPLKIAITGASGGIGRRMMARLGADYDVTGIVRSAQSVERTAKSPFPHVAFDDEPGLADALENCDVIFHGALDQKAKGKEFVPANQELNKRVLDLALAGQCKLFIYVSSQVVYSGGLPKAETGYTEEDPIFLNEEIDDYSRLKILSENEVIQSCRAAGVDCLIVRPSVVMGPGMAWSEDIVRALKYLPIGMAHRSMNLIHVDDLCEQVARLIKGKKRNDIFNLAGPNVPSEAYFNAAGRTVGRKIFFLPKGLLNWLGRFLPSTFWFFQHDVKIDASKIEEATGFSITREIENYFEPLPQVLRPQKIDDLVDIMRIGRPFEVAGFGHAAWFNQQNRPKSQIDLVRMQKYRGVVAIENGYVRVKAGTGFNELLAALQKKGLTLPTMPEYTGISLGACAFVPVHGSSSRFLSVQDIIEAVRYVDADGHVQTISRQDGSWPRPDLGKEKLIVSELVMRCKESELLQNRIEWVSDDEMDKFITSGFRNNLSSTVQWFPVKRQLMIYHIGPADPTKRNLAQSFIPFRGLAYLTQRLLFWASGKGKLALINVSHKVLAPWAPSLVEKVGMGMIQLFHRDWRDMEIMVSQTDGLRLIREIKAQIASNQMRFPAGQGIGIRFGFDQENKRHMVWIELVTSNPRLGDQFVQMVGEVCREGVAFHHGKYVPPSFGGADKSQPAGDTEASTSASND